MKDSNFPFKMAPGCGAALFFLLGSLPAEASLITLYDGNQDISALGTPTETRNSTGAYVTYNGRNFTGPVVNNVDTLDATFRLLVDFNDFNAGGAVNQVLWETGAGTIGTSIVYSSGNTLTMRHVSNGGNIVQNVVRNLTPGEVSGGDVELLWTMDLDGADTAINLWVNRAPLNPNVTVAASHADWSGSDGAGFGVLNSGIAAGGGNTQLPNSGTFASGTINTTTGLQFWADTTINVVVPEPTTTLGVLGLVASAFFRRRRRVMA